MKKIILVAALVLFSFTVNAQDDGSALSKGSWLLEANTGFGGGDLNVAHSAHTGFALQATDGYTAYSVGAEAGYFLADNLALKVGLGLNGQKLDGQDAVSTLTYKVGAKYYLDDKFPLQVDVTGATGESFGDDKPLWLGLQAGYAIFISNSVSVEPGLRYNVSLNQDFSDKGLFELRVGFVVHL